MDDDGPGSLRAQLAATDQPVPNGGGVINFAVSGTISLASTIRFRVGHPSVTIDGAGQQITISGGGNVRVFDVPAPMTFKLQNVTITGGKGDCGGGIRNNGFLSLKNVTMRGNTAMNGGAICSFDAAVSVDSSTFENNSADPGAGLGGALFIAIESRLDVVNSTFTNNRAGRGGAILNDGEPSTITSSTISGNTAQIGGGGLYLGTESFATPASFDLKNDIFSNNTGGNCGSSVSNPVWNDNGGNISYPDNTCPGAVVDPKLGALADNGGPTQTMALQAGSPAVDHAVDCLTYDLKPLTVDQRGVQRPQGSACDTGSYEGSALPFSWSFGPVTTAKAVQAVPIQFSVGQFAGMDIFAVGYPASRQVSCDTGQVIGPLTPIDTPGHSGLSYDSYHDQYQINWKTEKAWAGQCRELVVRLTDGVDHTALFRFR